MSDSEDADPPTTEELTNSILDRLSILRGTNIPTDFKIVHGEDEWPVHRLVLALHSPVLEKHCFSDFKEKKQGMIDLSAQLKLIVTAFVNYLYQCSYDVEKFATRVDDMPKLGNESINSLGEDPIGPYSFHARMALLGDYSDMPGLIAHASSKFCTKLDRASTGVVETSDFTARDAFRLPGAQRLV